jgi:hypothetical protein
MVSIIFKCGELIYKGQIYGTGGAVSLFADNYFRNTPAGVILALVVNLITVQKTDQVSILFNGAGLSQVRKLGTFVGPGFQAPVKL